MTVYDDVVLADNPILYLPLGDSSGTTAVALAGSDGTYSGGPTLQVDGPSNVIPHGISTDGSNDYLQTPTVSGLGAAQAQSWEVWVDAGVVWNTSNVKRFIFGPSNSYGGFGITGNITGQANNEVGIVGEHFTTNAPLTYWTGSTVPDSGWRHVVYTYSGIRNDWTWYIDGVDATDPAWGFTKSAANSGAAGVQNGQQWTIAVQLAGPNYSAFDGLAAFAIYDSELSAADVAHHFASRDIWEGSNSPMVMG